MSLNEHSTVGRWVAERPDAARVFERHGVDYCCGGKRSVADACAAHALNVPAVMAELRAAHGPAEGAAERDWTTATPTEIADHIQHTHHAYLWRELPRLVHLTNKVAAAHGPRHPELIELRDVFQAFHDEMVAHTNDEETVLFPLIRSLDQHRARPTRPIQAEVAHLESEHDIAGAALATMRRLTDDYAVPPDACNTYRALMSSLVELEADTHRHVHLENHVLFPKALAEEDAAFAGADQPAGVR